MNVHIKSKELIFEKLITLNDVFLGKENQGEGLLQKM